MKYGVYIITNLINNKVYIGSSSKCIRGRLGRHLNELKKNIHPSKHLQSAFNLYGEDKFKFEILECCLKEECVIREQHYLDTLLFAQEYITKEDNRFENLGYNKSPIAGNCLGARHTEETKKKHAINSAKRIWSEDSRVKLSNSKKGQIAWKVPVYQYTLSNDLITVWSSACEAANVVANRFGHGCGTTITSVCRGRLNHAYGYRWSYTDLSNSSGLN